MSSADDTFHTDAFRRMTLTSVDPGDNALVAGLRAVVEQLELVNENIAGLRAELETPDGRPLGEVLQIEFGVLAPDRNRKTIDSIERMAGDISVMRARRGD